MDEVVIAGGGPAGAFAALLLARAGARVRIFERSRFPRDKLCGDTLNPGALAILSRHLDVSPLVAMSGAIDGMLLTGPRGARVRARYAAGQHGRALTRRRLDQWLLERAIDEGAQVEDGVSVRDFVVTGSRAGSAVGGVGVRLRDGRVHPHDAALVVAADGRRSTLAFSRGLARQPARPRRWAIGGYFSDVDDLIPAGEMHVRDGFYLGVAPLPGGVTNVCLVVPHEPGGGRMPPPERLLVDRLHGDPELSRRFARARPVSLPVVLGPMAVDCDAAGEPGLLLAGDAAGFIDPMTGDGIRLALAGAELAAMTALDVLHGRIDRRNAHIVLAERRRAAFRAKWRFNRALRALVSSPRAIAAAALTSRAAPSIFEAVIRYAGDCGSAPAALAAPAAPVAPEDQ